jgi:hypothetical protein
VTPAAATFFMFRVITADAAAERALRMLGC